MWKPLTAVAFAAFIAAAASLLSVPTSSVDAGPLPPQDEATLKGCTSRPWPYLNCVGTRLGNPRVRLVTTDVLPGGQ